MVIEHGTGVRRRETAKWATAGCGLSLLVVGLGVVLVAAATLPIDGCDFDLGFTDPCRESDDPLIDAASRGDVDDVRERLDGGASPNSTDGNTSALSCAAGNHHAETATALLDAGATPTVEQLVDATYSGDTAIARSLLDAGAPVTAKVLTAAAGDGGNSHRPFSEMPLKAGTPAELDAIAALVLERGADPNEATEGPNPLLWAAYNGREPLVELLLAHGADPNVGGPVDEGLVRFAQLATPNGALYPPLSGPVVPNVPPLVAAAWTGQVAIATRLLDGGADPNLAADEAFTALYAAALRGDNALAETLLERGADPLPPVRSGVMAPSEVARAANHPDTAILIDTHR